MHVLQIRLRVLQIRLHVLQVRLLVLLQCSVKSAAITAMADLETGIS